MAISGRSYPNRPIVLKAEGVQVVGTQAIVVSGQPSRRFYVYNKGTRLEGSGELKQSPQVNLVVAAPVDRRWLRVNHPYTAQGSGVVTDVSPSPTPIVVTGPVDRRWLRIRAPFITAAEGVQVVGTQPIVVAAPRRKVLAPQPIIITGPLVAPDIPGSPPTVPLVFPGPDPRRTTKAPFILTTVEGITPVPPSGDDIDWCPGPPFTDWHADSVITGWDASDPATNWMALTPVEDC